jgi:hypothetical protein
LQQHMRLRSRLPDRCGDPEAGLTFAGPAVRVRSARDGPGLSGALAAANSTSEHRRRCDEGLNASPERCLERVELRHARPSHLSLAEHGHDRVVVVLDLAQLVDLLHVVVVVVVVRALLAVLHAARAEEVCGRGALPCAIDGSALAASVPGQPQQVGHALRRQAVAQPRDCELQHGEHALWRHARGGCCQEPEGNVLQQGGRRSCWTCPREQSPSFPR